MGKRWKRWKANRQVRTSGWFRTGHQTLLGSTSAGVQQQPRTLILGEALMARTGAALFLAAARGPQAKILRIVLRAVVQIITVSAPAVIEWWWGYRLVNETALDSTAEAAAESIFADTNDGKDAEWMGRKFVVCPIVTGAGPFVFTSNGGVPQIYDTCRVNRVIKPDEVLIFQHGWRINPSGDPATIATLTGTVAHDVEVEVP